MIVTAHPIHKYLRSSKKFPHIWCPGCGVGIFENALIRAIDRSGYTKDEIVLVSGIGCSSRLPVYVDFNTVHTTHGRALTFATGIKLANPGLKVITIMGDGDAVSIGGNHFIHAARRNVGITSFIVNNQIYGMTGGQCSPTTPHGVVTPSSPYGNPENNFDICLLAEAAGASFVARSSVYHTPLLDKLIDRALHKSGFSVVEVISPCVTYGSRWMGLGSPVEMMMWQKENCIHLDRIKGLDEQERRGKIAIGIFTDKNKPSYSEEYAKFIG